MSGPLSDVAAIRRDGDAAGAALPVPADVVEERVELARRQALSISIDGTTPDRTILHVHGGGYCLGSPLTHRDLGIRLARATDARVVLLEYRLAPEHPFPAAVDDVVGAVGALLELGVDPRALAVSGDSAGGGAVLAAAMSSLGADAVLPACLVLLSPWLDLRSPAVADRDPDGLGAARAAMAEAYRGAAAGDHPLVSPAAAPASALVGLPSLLVQVGAHEAFRTAAIGFHQLAVEAGVDAEIEVWDDCPHGWHVDGTHPHAASAIARIASYLDRHLAGPAKVPLLPS